RDRPADGARRRARTRARDGAAAGWRDDGGRRHHRTRRCDRPRSAGAVAAVSAQGLGPAGADVGCPRAHRRGGRWRLDPRAPCVAGGSDARAAVRVGSRGFGVRRSAFAVAWFWSSGVLGPGSRFWVLGSRFWVLGSWFGIGWVTSAAGAPSALPSSS